MGRKKGPKLPFSKITTHDFINKLDVTSRLRPRQLLYTSNPSKCLLNNPDKKIEGPKWPLNSQHQDEMMLTKNMYDLSYVPIKLAEALWNNLRGP